MSKKSFSVFFFILLFFSCQNLFYYGVRPKKIAESLEYENDVLHLSEEKIDVRYTIVDNGYRRGQDNDIIFYFHGIGRTELDWVDEESFGVQVARILKEHPEKKRIPVVSISFGLVFLMYKDLPYPYETDLESVFVDKLVPYFKEKLGCDGDAYLIGHSLGGLNALIIALRHPEKFKKVMAVSPFVLPFSPFRDDFKSELEGCGMLPVSIDRYQRWLSTVYKNESNWLDYNPYDLLDKDGQKPIIFFSSADNDYPGFRNFILIFKKKLEDKKLENYYFSGKVHKSISDEAFLAFLE